MPSISDLKDELGSAEDIVRRLVLCFDGTGNKFQANESDTNIVKIYQMLQKNEAGQYHYYQPGIGTYSKNQSGNSSGVGRWATFTAALWSIFDQAVGSSFVDHVLAGYQFIMRYYQNGDHIYIFGFSRGAYTARFLAEMIHNIGLLSKGNEEMVHFAWQTFSNYQISMGHEPQTQEDQDVKSYMTKFKDTFCRPHMTVHFLGLFDCVNSVGQFEIPFNRKSYQYIAMPAAKHIRHAVSIHERRLKFKPALFLLDEVQVNQVDLKEVWFSGNHGDVGGGWGLETGQNYLLSDTPLDWMISEVLNLPGSKSRLSFATTDVKRLHIREDAFPDADLLTTSTAWHLRKVTMQPHDMLRAGHGVGLFATVIWWIIEILPLFTRLELECGKWVPRHWPPNMGAARDIPADAVIHHSVDDMVAAGILGQSPRKGGDNSHFPDISSFTKGFISVRKKKLETKTENKTINGRLPLLTSEAHWTNHGIGIVESKQY